MELLQKHKNEIIFENIWDIIKNRFVSEYKKKLCVKSQIIYSYASYWPHKWQKRWFLVSEGLKIPSQLSSASGRIEKKLCLFVLFLSVSKWKKRFLFASKKQQLLSLFVYSFLVLQKKSLRTEVLINSLVLISSLIVLNCSIWVVYQAV